MIIQATKENFIKSRTYRMPNKNTENRRRNKIEKEINIKNKQITSR